MALPSQEQERMRDVERTDVESSGDVLTISVGQYSEQVAWHPPVVGGDGKPEMWGNVETAHGSVRVVAPRGWIPSTTRYPAPLPGPRVRFPKRPMAPEDLTFFPHSHTPEHPTSWEFPSYLDNPGCHWLQTLKRMYEMPISFPASLSPESGLMLHSLVRNIRPKRVIETGTFVGISTLWIASALAENGDGGVIHTFDDMTPIQKGPWREVEITHDRIHFVAEQFAESGLADHIVMHPGNSAFEIRAMQKDLIEVGGVQLAFLDADHGYVGVCQDLWASEPLLNTGGYLLFHDTFPSRCSYDGPRRVIDELNEIAVGTYESCDFYLAPMNYGMAIARRIG